MDENLNDMHVSFVGDFPITSSTPVLGEQWPPGDWTRYKQFKESTDKKFKELLGYLSDAKQLTAVELISQDRTKIALGSKPDRQKHLPLVPEEPIGSESADPSPEIAVPNANEHQEMFVGTVSKEAFLIAESLLDGNDREEHISAEQFMSAIRRSPDPVLTAALLRSAGTGMRVSGNGISSSPSKHRRFPATIVSEFLYRLCVLEFGRLEETMVMVAFDQLHQPIEDQENTVGKLLQNRKRIPLSFGNSKDEIIFRMGVAAKIPMDVMVSISLSTYDREISGFTLSRLTDRLATADLVVQFVEQYRRPVDRA